MSFNRVTVIHQIKAVAAGTHKNNAFSGCYHHEHSLGYTVDIPANDKKLTLNCIDPAAVGTPGEPLYFAVDAFGHAHDTAELCVHTAPQEDLNLSRQPFTLQEYMPNKRSSSRFGKFIKGMGTGVDASNK